MPRFGMSVVLLAAAVSSAAAERVPLSPEQLQKESTNIVTGKLLAIYSRDVESTLYGPGTIETRFVLEVEVDRVEKGEGVKPKDIIYVRCWRVKKHGAAGLVPGPGGHQIPQEGAELRFYLARGRYGPTGQNDHGYAVVYPNGMEPLQKPAAK